MNHSILYGIARSFCGCQASFISVRQKQSVASNPPCTCRFIKWHHTASWDFLFYGKFSKACEFACPTSAFMILSHSRKQTAYALMVKRLRRRPLTAESGVRFPMRVPKKCSKPALFILPRRGTKKKQSSLIWALLFSLFTTRGIERAELQRQNLKKQLFCSINLKIRLY